MIRYIRSIWTGPFGPAEMCILAGTITAAIHMAGTAWPPLVSPIVPPMSLAGHIVCGMTSLSLIGLGVILRSPDGAISQGEH